VLKRGLALRAATHAATWLPFTDGAIATMRGGWLPINDNAAIAVRSWDALTRYGPMLGQPSRLAPGVYDPGPAQYWLLALPVHADPMEGALWGAALWCMLACSLAIEAARSAAGTAGGVLAAAGLLGAILWIPGVTHLPVWNPWFGLMFFLAALAAAWAVLAGRRWWWPALVITASVAAQAHLMYALACGALVLVALAVGLADSLRARAGWWWLVPGVIAGLGCWSLPLIQEFTARHGNLSALLHDSGSAGPAGGLAFGLRAVAASVQPAPVWWTSFPRIHSLGLAGQRPAAAGVAAFVLLAAIGVAASLRPLRSRLVAALAALGLVVGLAAAVTFAAIPAASIAQQNAGNDSLTYLMAPMYPVGMVTWLAVAAAAALLARRVVAWVRAARTVSAPAAAGPQAEGGSARRARRITATPWLARGAGTLAAVGALALASFCAADGAQAAPRSDADFTLIQAITLVSRAVRAELPAQRLKLSVTGLDQHFRRGVTLGLAYVLVTDGYRPEVVPHYAWQLGPAFTFHGQSVLRVIVKLSPRSYMVVIGQPPISLTDGGGGGHVPYLRLS